MRRVIKWSAIITGVLLLPVGYAVAYETLSIVLPPVLYVGGAVAILSLLLGGIGAWLVGWQIVRTRIAELDSLQVIAAANAQMALAEAEQKRVMVITAPRDHQLVIKADPQDYFRQMHLAPQSHVNGIAATITPEQMAVYRDYHGRGPVAPEPLMIDAPTELDERPLLPALRHAANILIVGGTQTGKTTLMQWIEAERIGSQEIVIMDSHAEPAQWQGRMVGLGRDYEAIVSEMKLSLRELDRRYKSRTRGDKSYQATTAIIDEFTLLPATLRDDFDFEVKTYSRPLLTEGRKVKMNCIWGIHSDRAEALGLQGAMDLKECFDVIVHLKNVKDHRFAICDFGEGKEETRYAHPGPFIAPRRVEAKTPQRPKATPEERNILRAWWPMKDQEKVNATKLHRAIRPDLASKPSGQQLDKYRDVIKKFGYEPKF